MTVYVDVKPPIMVKSGYVEIADAAQELGVTKGKLRDAIQKSKLDGVSARGWIPRTRSYWITAATLAELKARTRP